MCPATGTGITNMRRIGYSRQPGIITFFRWATTFIRRNIIIARIQDRAEGSCSGSARYIEKETTKRRIHVLIQVFEIGLLQCLAHFYLNIAVLGLNISNNRIYSDHEYNNKRKHTETNCSTTNRE